MKFKKISTLVLACTIFSSSLFAAGSIPIYVEGKAIDASNTPAYVSTTDRTMIPVRAVGEVLGLDVQWQTPYAILIGNSLKTGKQVTVKMNTRNAQVSIDGTVLTNAIEAKDGRSYVTLRVLAEAFGYQVDWRNKCVYIDKPQNINTGSANAGNTSTGNANAGNASTGNTSNTGSTNVGSDSQANASFDQQVLDLVNAERAKSGLSALQLDESLCKAASVKASDMSSNNYFSHTSPTYGSPFEMLKQFGISYSAAAENIAQGYTTPQAVVNGWMNSSGHRANIMNSSYTHMGIGYDSNGHYWSQLFIKK